MNAQLTAREASLDRRLLSGWLGVIVMVGVWIASSRGGWCADDTTASVRIGIAELESILQVGADRNSPTIRVAARVVLTNTSRDVVSVARDQFVLLVNERASEFGLQESQPAFPTDVVKPGGSVEGWVWFSQIPVDGTEPVMTLVWEPPQPDNGQQPLHDARVSVNDEVRRIGRTQATRIGPDACVLKIVVARHLDVLAIWTLNDVLKSPDAAGAERIAFVPEAGRQPVVMDEFVMWISSLMERAPGDPLPSTPFKTTGLAFRHVSIGGLPQSANRRFNAGRGAVLLHDSPDDAICAAATPVYRFIPVDRALTDLQSDEPGLRRAALAGTVDRLTPEQTARVLELVEVADEDFQMDAAAALQLIPGPESIAALMRLGRSSRGQVATVALHSLAASQDAAAGPAMEQLWTASHERPELRRRIVETLIELRDDRWLPLLSAYLRELLTDAVSGTIRAAEAAPSEDDKPTERASLVARILELLRERHADELLPLVRSHLLTVSDPAVQDALLNHLLRTDVAASSALIRDCVTARLAANSDTLPVRMAASQLRDPRWTDALVAAAKQSEASRNGTTAIQAALACATPEQLQAILEDFSEFRIEQQEMILALAAQTDQPGWRSLAAVSLEHPGPLSTEAIQLLGQDASDESLQLLRDRLEDYTASLEGTADASVEGQRFFHALIVQVSLFSHPDCRRLMNRLARDRNTWVRDIAERRIFEASRRSPAFRALEDAHRMRMSGQLDNALTLLNLAVTLDPLLPEGFLRRASVLMNLGRLEDAQADLQTAIRLSPEELESLSMNAIVQIRLGQTEAGLQQAEDVIALAPGHWVALYNGACAYARAAEQSASLSAQRLAYEDRAIQLLNETADMKFSDVEHLQKDADLNPLRDHVMWPEVVKRVAGNKLPQTAEAPKADR